MLSPIENRRQSAMHTAVTLTRLRCSLPSRAGRLSPPSGTGHLLSSIESRHPALRHREQGTMHTSVSPDLAAGVNPVLAST